MPNKQLLVSSVQRCLKMFFYLFFFFQVFWRFNRCFEKFILSTGALQIHRVCWARSSNWLRSVVDLEGLSHLSQWYSVFCNCWRLIMWCCKIETVSPQSVINNMSSKPTSNISVVIWKDARQRCKIWCSLSVSPETEGFNPIKPETWKNSKKIPVFWNKIPFFSYLVSFLFLNLFADYQLTKHDHKYLKQSKQSLVVCDMMADSQSPTRR